MIAYVANQSGKDQKILAKRCYNMECVRSPSHHEDLRTFTTHKKWVETFKSLIISKGITNLIQKIVEPYMHNKCRIIDMLETCTL